MYHTSLRQCVYGSISSVVIEASAVSRESTFEEAFPVSRYWHSVQIGDSWEMMISDSPGCASTWSKVNSHMRCEMCAYDSPQPGFQILRYLARLCREKGVALPCPNRCPLKALPASMR